MPSPQDHNRFQAFFEEETYVVLKNRLYNYQVRKRAIEPSLALEESSLVLEVGSGLSPIVTSSPRVVFSELSHLALKTLRRHHGKGWYVVADATRLPFKTGAFTHCVCSEVLEHIPDDQSAIRELARVAAPGGDITITVPYRQWYFALDDRFVHHHRRYEPGELEKALEAAGAHPESVRKILGPMEKALMLSVIALCAGLFNFEEGRKPPSWVYPLLRGCAPLFGLANRLLAALARLDACIMPMAWATCVMIKARKLGPDGPRLPG